MDLLQDVGKEVNVKLRENSKSCLATPAVNSIRDKPYNYDRNHTLAYLLLAASAISLIFYKVFSLK